MKKWILAIILLLIVFIVGFFLGGRMTGNVIGSDNKYSYTRAFCNEEGLCVDVVVFCSSGEVEKIEPIMRFVNITYDNDQKQADLCK